MSKQSNALQFIKPGIRNSPSFPRMSAVGASRRLHWNENPYDFPADLKEEVLDRMAQRPWSHYPDGLRPVDLINALAARWEIESGQIVAAAGSAALIQVILNSVLGPHDHMVMPSPTFLLYRRNIGLAGAQVHEVPLHADENFALPVAELIVAARTNEAKLIAVCAPNNPTGTVYALEDLRRLADEGGALLVVDEAYAEFCDQDLRPLLDEFDNVVLVRTFSKAFAMAGQRVGYALAHPTIAAELDKSVPSFPVSTFSETMALVALAHRGRFMENVTQTVAERERLASALGDLPGVTVYPSGTNFLLVHVPVDRDAVVRRLLEGQGILISNMAAYPELAGCLRISVGLPEDNDRVVAVLQELIDAQV